MKDNIFISAISGIGGCNLRNTTSKPVFEPGQRMSPETWENMDEHERYQTALNAAAAPDEAMLSSLTNAWIMLYGKAGSNVSVSTLRNYRTGINQMLSAWKPNGLLKPKPDAAREWVSSMQRKGRKPLTVQSRLAAGRALYAALRWTKVVDFDPFVGVRVEADPTPSWEKSEPYTQDEIDALLRGAIDPHDRLLVLLGADAGLRSQEGCNLKWGDIKFHTPPTLIVQNGKGNRKRTLEIGGDLVEALQAVHPQGSTDYVLPWRKPITSWRRMEKLSLAVGVEPKGVQALRNAAGTRIYSETGDLEATARYLGHTDLEAVRPYINWGGEGQKKASKEGLGSVRRVSRNRAVEATPPTAPTPLSLFVASSTEGLDVAYAVQYNLEHNIEVTVWPQGVFEPSKSSLESLTKALDDFDAAVFVFTPDDIVTMRGTEHHAVRDNVIFESGLFIGRLGREKCFFLTPRTGQPFQLPSDLIGVSPLTYDATSLDYS